jgi:hypothetical protein
VNARPRQSVAFAHIAGADQSNSYSAHGSPSPPAPSDWATAANTNISYATEIGISVLFAPV